MDRNETGYKVGHWDLFALYLHGRFGSIRMVFHRALC